MDHEKHEQLHAETVKLAVRKRLEDRHGKVWNTDELQEDFKVIGFTSPFVAVERKSDGMTGTLEFTHMPRFYFDFVPSSETSLGEHHD
jgi:hypothetical protein